MTTLPPATDGKPVSEMHDRLLNLRAKLIAEHADKLADIDAAIAAIVARKIPPPLTVDRRECKNCAGWLVFRADGFWVHDRDGSPACTPGHSGTVAEPMTRTTAFPAVPPLDATQVIPAVPPPPPMLDPDCRGRKHASCVGEPCECFCHVYAYLLGHHVGVVLADGSAEIWGELEGVDGEGLAIRDGQGVTNSIKRTAIGHVMFGNGQRAHSHGKPADLDQVAATPAEDGGE